MPTVEVLLQLKLSAFTCRTDEAVSKQCDSDALIHPTDRRNKALRAARQCTCPLRQKPPDTIMVVCAALRLRFVV